MLIKSIKYFMIIAGTWNVDWTEEPILRTTQTWYRRINQGTVITLHSLVFVKLIQLFLFGADVDAIYKCGSVYLSILASCTKAYIYQRDDVSELFEEILNDEQKLSQSKDKEVNNLYKRNVDTFIKIKNVVIASTSFTTVVFLLFKTINYIKTDEQTSEKELIQDPFIIPMWLPFNERDNILSVFFINVFMLFCSANVYLAVELTFFTLLLFIADKLKGLQVIIQNLDKSLENMDHVCAVGILKDIVKEHFFIIRFVYKLNKYTSYVMLTNFLTISINVASVAIVILSQISIREIAFPLTHLLQLVFYVFLLGWFSNEIMVQSMALGDELYQTKWYNQDIRIQKLLLLMMRQSQQPLTVSIGPFAAMTLEKALRIMRAAYSYVTLMRNFK